MKTSVTPQPRFESKRAENQAVAGRVGVVLARVLQDRPWLGDNPDLDKLSRQIRSLADIGGDDDTLLRQTYDSLRNFLATVRPPQNGVIVPFPNPFSTSKPRVSLDRILPETLDAFKERHASHLDSYNDDAVHFAAEAVYMGECELDAIRDEFRQAVIDAVFDEVSFDFDDAGAVIEGDRIKLCDDIPRLEGYPRDRILEFMSEPDGRLYNLLTCDEDDDSAADGADGIVIRTILEERQMLRERIGEVVRPHRQRGSSSSGFTIPTLGDFQKLQQEDPGAARFVKSLIGPPHGGRETSRERRLRIASRIMKPRIVR